MQIDILVLKYSLEDYFLKIKQILVDFAVNSRGPLRFISPFLLNHYYVVFEMSNEC